jgi:type III pantothenate kinase
MGSVITFDIGNTRTKFAVFSADGSVIDSGADCEIADVLNRHTGAKVIYSTVVSEMNVHLANKMAFSVSLCRDIQILVKNTETLGKDRLAAVMGAKFLFGNKNCLVIDAGTCITYDYLLDNGDYLGGAISMGIGMRYTALNAFTSKLPSLKIDETAENIDDVGMFTEEAIHSGVCNGLFDEVNARIDRFKAKYDHSIVIFTGGDAKFLAKHIKYEIFAEPLLVHYGLYHAIQTT